MGSGLPPSLVAAILGLLSALLAALLLKGLELDAVVRRWAITFFVLVAVAIPVLGNFMLVLLFCTGVLVLVRPKQSYLAVPVFVCSLLLFPDYIHYRIPFPGLNYLVEYQLWVGLAWLTLLPIMLRSRMSLDKLDLAFLTFAVLVIALDFRHVSFTEGLRRSFISVSWFLIPYFSISRGLDRRASLSLVFQSLFVAITILACAMLFVQLRNWDFLRYTEPSAGLFTIREYRFGLLRSGTTMSSGLFGLLCGMSFLILMFQLRTFRIRKWATLVVAGALVFGLLASGTRAALLIAPLMFLAYVACRFITLRLFVIGVALCLVSVPIIIQRIVTFDTSGFENPANIEYRQRLLGASVAQMESEPLFGEPDFLNSPRFASLVQGQGIVDIVNTYLQIGLEYGIATLAAFAAAYIIALGRIVKRIAEMRGNAKIPEEGRLLFAFLVGYVLFIGTISSTSYVAIVGTILIALARAVVVHWDGMAECEVAAPERAVS